MEKLDNVGLTYNDFQIALQDKKHNIHANTLITS